MLFIKDNDVIGWKTFHLRWSVWSCVWPPAAPHWCVVTQMYRMECVLLIPHWGNLHNYNNYNNYSDNYSDILEKQDIHIMWTGRLFYKLSPHWHMSKCFIAPLWNVSSWQDDFLLIAVVHADGCREEWPAKAAPFYHEDAAFLHYAPFNSSISVANISNIMISIIVINPQHRMHDISSYLQQAEKHFS